MGWAEAIKAAIIAVPEIVGLIRDLKDEFARLSVEIRNKKIQEVRDAQNQLEAELRKVQNDEERMAFARRIADLERRL